MRALFKKNLFRSPIKMGGSTGLSERLVHHLISLIFAIHVSFIRPLPMMWILLTKPMQKSVNTFFLHCRFARLKNKHMGVLGTNVATKSWLHWSPVSGYKSWQRLYTRLTLTLNPSRVYTTVALTLTLRLNPYPNRTFIF